MNWFRLSLSLASLAVLGTLTSCRGNSKEQENLRISEITLERIWTSCIGCGDYKVILRKEGSDPDKDVLVAYSEAKTDLRSGGLPRQSTLQRKGRLRSSYFHRLAMLLDSQGYFELKEHYGGRIDTLIVKTTAVRDGIRKAVLDNSDEGPIQLWGVEMAIDGALARVEWEQEQLKPLQP